MLPMEGRLRGTPELLFPNEKRDGTRSGTLTLQSGEDSACEGVGLVLNADNTLQPPGVLIRRAWPGPGIPSASPGDPVAGSSQLNRSRFLLNFQAKHRVCCFCEGDQFPCRPY